MKILMVTSEAAPFAKTGGLADVLGALPAALARLGEEVAVVLPKYSAVTVPTEPAWLNLRLWVGSHSYTVDIRESLHKGVRYLFVDCPVLFDRPTLYDEPDNHIRFALLNQASCLA